MSFVGIRPTADEFAMTVAFGYSDADRERFRVLLGDEAEVIGDIQDLHAYLEAHPDEDLLVVGPALSMPVATDLAERYRVKQPSLGIVLLRERVDTNVLAEALRAGIREVVPASDAEALSGACKRSLHLSAMQRGVEGGGNSLGKVILVFGAKGGCGKTTISTNLAASLAELGEGSVCIVDFDVDFGDVAIFLQLSPDRTLSDAVPMAGDIDPRALEGIVSKYGPGMDALLAPIRPSEAELVTPDLAAEVVRNLCQMYRFVVIDAPPAFTEITLRAFDIADSYVLVTALDLPALKNLKVALETLDALGYPRSKWNVVLNRANAKVGLTLTDVEEILGVPITTSVPSSREVPAVLNAGKTMVEEHPKHPVSIAIGQLADAQAGRRMRKGPRRRWWKRSSK